MKRILIIMVLALLMIGVVYCTAMSLGTPSSPTKGEGQFGSMDTRGWWGIGAVVFGIPVFMILAVIWAVATTPKCNECGKCAIGRHTHYVDGKITSQIFYCYDHEPTHLI